MPGTGKQGSVLQILSIEATANPDCSLSWQEGPKTLSLPFESLMIGGTFVRGLAEGVHAVQVVGFEPDNGERNSP